MKVDDERTEVLANAITTIYENTKPEKLEETRKAMVILLTEISSDLKRVIHHYESQNF